MLETLKPHAADKIIELLGLFAADPRADKLDLGVGVYKDADGRTPVMRAVKAAEARLLEGAGQQGLRRPPRRSRLRRRRWAISPSVTRAARPAERGADPGRHRRDPPALRADPPREPGRRRSGISDPTWPNHPAILGHLGMPARSYRYFDAATGGRRFRRDDRGPRRARRRATWSCCTAAATTRPGRT